MTLVTSLLTELSNAMSSIFLLLLTVVFMLLEAPQLPAEAAAVNVQTSRRHGRHPAGHRQRIALSGAENCDKPITAWWSARRCCWTCASPLCGGDRPRANDIPNIGSAPAAIPPILQVLVFGGCTSARAALAG